MNKLFDKYEEINDDFEKLKQDILEFIPKHDDKGSSFKVDTLLDSMENNLSVILSILDDVQPK